MNTVDHRNELIEYIYQLYADIGIERNKTWPIKDETNLYLVSLASNLNKIKLSLNQLKKH